MRRITNNVMFWFKMMIINNGPDPPHMEYCFTNSGNISVTEDIHLEVDFKLSITCRPTCL